MAGHSRSRDGVAEFTLGLAEGKTRGLAYVPAIQVFLGSKDVDARIRGITLVRRINRSFT
jgi:hypothetical protein